VAWTSHGHEIPGSVLESEPPAEVARCGGPGLCDQCSRETSSYLFQSTSEDAPQEAVRNAELIGKIIASLIAGGFTLDQSARVLRTFHENGLSVLEAA
jgi:hypothetical protein